MRYLIIAILALLPWSAEGQPLTFVYPPEKNAFHDAAAEILRVAYQQLGVSISFKTFPAERALVTSNKGRADGELVRIKGINKKYPNLIRVPVSHVSSEQTAFSKRVEIVIEGWHSLNSPLIKSAPSDSLVP